MCAARRGEGQARRPAALTAAERRVLPLLATHLTLAAIAQQLDVSRSTVKTHVANMYRKLGACSRAEAIEQARAAGLLPRAATDLLPPALVDGGGSARSAEDALDG
ncbi:MAG TPA: LuxR C-terminal-related transcriptional regulator [Conexibacter sp.]